MTCIAAVAEKGTVWIGGDSAGVAGYDLTLRADEKVFTRGPFVFGFTSSFRMGQLLRYRLETPAFDVADAGLSEYMATTFVDAVRKCLREGGWLTKEKEQESGGTFIVGARGRIFVIHGDFQVGEPLDGFGAVGCGRDIALGSLYTTEGLAPETRLLTALKAAERFSAGVRAPFVVRSL